MPAGSKDAHRKGWVAVGRRRQGLGPHAFVMVLPPGGNPEDGLDEHTWHGLEHLESLSGPGAVEELAGDFARDAGPRLQAMRQALGQGHREAFRRLAHDLKSNSATLGATRLAGLGARMEQEALDATEASLLVLLDRASVELEKVLRAVENRVKAFLPPEQEGRA